jgi:hypothetical protein
MAQGHAPISLPVYFFAKRAEQSDFNDLIDRPSDSYSSTIVAPEADLKRITNLL